MLNISLLRKLIRWGANLIQAELFKGIRIVSASLVTAELKWIFLCFNKAKVLHCKSYCFLSMTGKTKRNDFTVRQTLSGRW